MLVKADASLNDSNLSSSSDAHIMGKGLNAWPSNQHANENQLN